MANTEIIKEFNTQYNFWTIRCAEGHKITNWDRKDLRNFSAFEIAYCPEDTNTDNYYCITDTEYQELIKKQEEQYKLDEQTEREKESNSVVE